MTNVNSGMAHGAVGAEIRPNGRRQRTVVRRSRRPGVFREHRHLRHNRHRVSVQGARCCKLRRSSAGVHDGWDDAEATKHDANRHRPRLHLMSREVNRIRESFDGAEP